MRPPDTLEDIRTATQTTRSSVYMSIRVDGVYKYGRSGESCCLLPGSNTNAGWCGRRQGRSQRISVVDIGELTQGRHNILVQMRNRGD